MHILFDLDGTLTDPKVGITKCIESALGRLNCLIPKDLDWCIGPPLQDSFLEIIQDESKVDLAITYYRERFAKVGMFENEIYQGIEECLDHLVKSGHKLYLATSKPLVYAKEILKYFNLQAYFKGQYGSELDGTRKDKSELIHFILKQEGINPKEALMIGDRKFDIIGAKNNGLASMGVTYGYGTLLELENEKPWAIVHSPQEIVSILTT